VPFIARRYRTSCAISATTSPRRGETERILPSAIVEKFVAVPTARWSADLGQHPAGRADREHIAGVCEVQRYALKPSLKRHPESRLPPSRRRRGKPRHLAGYAFLIGWTSSLRSRTKNSGILLSRVFIRALALSRICSP